MDVTAGVPGAATRVYIKPPTALQSFCCLGTALWLHLGARPACTRRLSAGHHGEQAVRHRQVSGIRHVKPAQELRRGHLPGEPVLQKHLAYRVQALGQA